MFTFPVAHFGGELSFTIDQSIRFNDNDSAHLSRTISTPTSTQKFTFNTWIKPCTFFNDTASRAIFSAATPGNSSSDRDIIGWENDALYVAFNTGSWNEIKTSQVFHDPASWYMITIAMDSTQSTASNRTKIYVNGSQLTDFSTASYVTQNDTIAIATSGKLQAIGAYAFDITAANDRIDGYLAEINFIDGQQLAPTSFGETNSDTGQWVPVKYAGAYSGNSFYLKGQNSSALGDDSSGLGNDFTSSGLAAADQMSDSPTDNHCTLNPLWVDGHTLSDGNLVASAAADSAAIGTMAFDVTDSAGFYFEAKVTTAATYPNVGIRTVESPSKVGAVTSLSGNSTGRYSFTGSDGNFNDAGSSSSYGSAWAGTADKVIGVLVKAGALYFSIDGTIQNSGTAAKTGLTGYMLPTVFYDAGSGTTAAWEMRFDKADWGTTPSGYKSISTASLPDPGIVPSEHFNTVLYTGNGSTGQSITGVGFQPDFVWTKIRSPNAYSHQLFDAVRGAGKNLQTNNTNAEGDLTSEFTSFDSDGFTIDDVAQNVNENSSLYVAWNWKANGSGGSNDAGDITSTVSANTTSGFSIVTYSGSGSSGDTVAHGLGVKPAVVIVKPRNASDHWIVNDWSGNYANKLKLNDTEAASSSSGFVTAATSSTFTLGSDVGVNGSGRNYVAYCFAEIEGFSSFGSFVGNGSATAAPFIYTGFRPALVVTKNITNSGDAWPVADTARSPFNVANATVFWNSNNAETTGYSVDLLSNGFRPFSSDHGINESGATILYAAWAESPFKTSLAR